MNRSYYRWVIVAAGGLLGCVAIGALFSLPVFIRPISRDTGWSITGISSAMTFGFLAMAVGSIVWGNLSDRFGPRVIVLIGSCVLASALALASLALLVRRPPALMSGNAAPATREEPQAGITVGQAIRSPQFITLVLTKFFLLWHALRAYLLYGELRNQLRAPAGRGRVDLRRGRPGGSRWSRRVRLSRRPVWGKARPGHRTTAAGIRCYDLIHVQAIINQIHGYTHDRRKWVGVPALFGTNFQAVSVGQKLNSDPVTGEPGGYADVLGKPAAGWLLSWSLLISQSGVSLRNCASRTCITQR